MHNTTPTASLLRGIWGLDHEGHALDGWRLSRVSIPLAQVVVEVRYRVWYCHPEPVAIIILVVICNEGGVVLCVVDLHGGDMVLQRVLEVFVC